LPESDLALLIRAARHAGDVARACLAEPLEVRDKGDGAGPVTRADLAVDAALAALLREARPGYGWLSEESPEEAARLAAQRVFIVDPIDGTRSLIAGETTWAHSLAITDGSGRALAGVVYLPLMDRLYAAAEGAGATLNGAPIAVTRRAEVAGGSILATKPVFEPRHWPGGLPEMTRAHRPSLAYRLSLVAEGRYDAMVTLRPTWEWDIAAGSVILAEAGARVTDRSGAALRFNNPHPQTDGLLAANAALHGALLARMG
jgi:myo-inositol-1(or 4)-monophosphatase